MKQKIFRIIKAVFKNLLVFIGGAFLGLVTTLLFAKQLLQSLADKDIGLAVIAVAPIVLMMYAIMFGVAGGTLAVIIYNVRKFIKRKREKRNQQN